ncbi:MAG: tripartite tricarboxylate transporter substrate binding protein [Betaproteobacteria bacterium]|nr:tripartite tricarboxylate transporter substrate binding protein [Betaproteobacteria bacterium]
MKRLSLGFCSALLPLTALSTFSHAQSYPAKPVRLIVPFAAGGPVDTVARLLAPRLSESWGQQVVIDNRAGANSIIGSEVAARAPADGYTLLIVSAGFAINVSLQPKLPYDSLRDFTPITTVAFGPGILVTHPSLPVRNLKELIAFARARPGALTYGSSGAGAPTSHLGMELLKSTAGLNIVHVPYKSMAPALTDILGGQVHMGIPTINVTVQHVRSGRLRAMGVTSLTRSPIMPDVPPLAEAGMPGYEATNWTLILGPAGFPAAIAEKIHADTAKALQAQDLRDRYTAAGMEARSLPFAQVAEHVRSEIAKWSRVVKASGAKPEG